MRLEEAMEWAARHGFHRVDFYADRQPNHLGAWDATECLTRSRAIMRSPWSGGG
jgi:hypothetical protein